MENNNFPDENFEDIPLDKLFDDANFNTSEIYNSFEEYRICLESFFTKYNSANDTRFINHFEVFDTNYLNEDDMTFVSNSLSIANYDVNSLRGENVILFPEPVIVSSLSCTNVTSDENTGALRLITWKGSDKKIVSKKFVINSHTINRNLITTYKVHDVVMGLILPMRCNFESVTLATYASLHTDFEKLEHTQKALVRAQEAPAIEMQNVKTRVQYIDSVIEIKRNKFNAMKGDIGVLEQEKRHAENSLENTKNSLNKVRKDLNDLNNEYEKLAVQISSSSETYVVLKEQIKIDSKLQKSEKIKLDQLQDQTKQTVESLDSIKLELAAANRQKNLTTLDMVGHSDETSRQLKPYYLLAVLVFIGLAWMARYIYLNGESFSSIIPYLVDVSSWDILISRLPLITATTLIIGGLSGAFFYIVKHIVSLNTEKMTMLKAAILAEQITNSIDCKDMSEQEKLEFKRDTKIKLIMQVFSKNETTLEVSNLIIDALKAANPK